MKNLSDGIKDGIVLFYAMDGVLYPVGLTKEQTEALDLTIGLGLKGKLMVVTDKPMGELVDLK